ncbi:MAG TPA: LCP family protein [Gaiellaceae bacterium]|nr:LCP family protein [Gaiellaceae bacterium]
MTSVTRYKPPDPPRRPFVRQILRGAGWFALVLVVIGAGIGGGLYLYAHESLGAISTHTRAGHQAATVVAPIKSPSQPAIALVAGYDHRAGTGTSAYAGSNSDTLMLIRADPTNDTLSLLSFPRDLSVPIYCKGDVATTTDRINAAWADCGSNGGPAAAVDTMEHLTGLKINYLITLDFHAFKQIVNRLHGVYMNVDQRYYIPPHTGTSAINLQPGYYRLDGGQALSYVRFRHFDSDIYRNGRQQLFMAALKTRLRQELSITNIRLIAELVGALKGNLEVIKYGGAGLDFSEVQRYLNLAYKLPPGHLVRNSIPITDLTPFVTSGGADELQATHQVVAAAVHRFSNPVVPKAPVKKSGGGKSAKKLAKKDISVLVLNAGNVTGEAANTTVLLKRQGFATTKLPQSVQADAPRLTHPTTIYYNPQQATAKQAAQQLAPYFGSCARIAPMTSAIGAFARQANDPLTVAAIGTCFSGRLTLPSSSNPSKTKVPPQVQDGLPVTLSAVRGEYPKAHFRLMVPGKVALGSALSQNEGVRLFSPLAGKQELVLTFNVNGGVEYWQIEESNWSSAPILQSPTYHLKYHHETLGVYTSSGQIQMVAIRTAKASYWVVNSILNNLSNSTMLAIAESLKPLGR